MKKVFRMSDLGALSFYLGIEVKQMQSGIELCQSSYAVKLPEKAGMKGSKIEVVKGQCIISSGLHRV
jgi:hypothetical protein